MDAPVAATAVFDVLMKACSQDASVLKPAESLLKQWETQPGFYSILASVFTRRDVDVSVRWLAVLYFKNGVDRYWRRNAPSAISEDEKESLRQKLTADFSEPINQIAVQLSVLIGKIARLDCPRSWPQLIPVLLEAIQVTDPLSQQRALQTLYSVIKSLASRRLPADRKVFEDLTRNMFGYIFELWEANNGAFSDSLRLQDATACVTFFDQAYLCLRVLRKLAVFGVTDLDKNEQASAFMNIVFERLEHFLDAKAAVSAVGQHLLSRRSNMIELLSKIPLDVVEYHAEHFVPFIRPSLELTVVFNFTSRGTGLIFEQFSVNTLNLMRFILRCEAYTPAKTLEESKSEVTLAARQIFSDFFTVQMLTELCRQLVLNYFPLQENELKSWQTDPENFVCDESGDSCKFSLRPCQENLFTTLVKEFRLVCPQVIMELVNEQENVDSSKDLSVVLCKDAVYCAVGLASYELYDFIDFDNWFMTKLIADLNVVHTNYRIIRRRVAWLVGCWISVKVSPNLRPTVYECLIVLLQPTEDIVVRLEAAQTLKLAADDFEFSVLQFSPYLEASFRLLFQLLQDVSQCDSKMSVLHVMSLIIERMQAEIRPHVSCLIRYMPLLWDSSMEHGMLCCAIISTLTTVVLSIGSSCVDMHDLLLPVIYYSTDVQQAAHVYLCEDGLDLWLATLQCSPSLTSPLVDLFSNMSALFELGSDTLKTCLKITEAYLLLGSREFLQKCGSSLLASLTSILSDLKDEGAVLVCRLLETLLQMCPSEGSELCSPLFANILGAVSKQRNTCTTALMSAYLALLSRLVFSVPTFFWPLVDKVALHCCCTSSELMLSVLDHWLDALDNVVNSFDKKLSVLALASMLSANVPCVLDRFAGIVCACVETLHDVCCSDSDSSVQIDGLVMTGEPNAEELETEHDRRRFQLSVQDPVHIVALDSFVLSQLSHLQHTLGDAVFSSLMQTVDSEVLQQLQLFVKH